MNEWMNVRVEEELYRGRHGAYKASKLKWYNFEEKNLNDLSYRIERKNKASKRKSKRKINSQEIMRKRE